MSDLSRFKNFVFSHLFAAAARAQSSTNASTSAAGAAVLSVPASDPGASASVISAALGAAHDAIGTVKAGVDAHKSAVGIANEVVGGAETAIKAVVDGYVAATVGGLPIVGGFLAPEAVHLANVALDFGEQHLLTYISALFAHNKAVASLPAPPPALDASVTTAASSHATGTGA